MPAKKPEEFSSETSPLHISEIRLQTTNAKTALILGASGGETMAVGDIDVTDAGPLGRINGKAADLHGDVTALGGLGYAQNVWRNLCSPTRGLQEPARIFGARGKRGDLRKTQTNLSDEQPGLPARFTFNKYK